MQIRNGENCDDGNTQVENCIYGIESCQVCGEQCVHVPGLASYCGDGLVDSDAGEICDGGAHCDMYCQPIASDNNGNSCNSSSSSARPMGTLVLLGLGLAIQRRRRSHYARVPAD